MIKLNKIEHHTIRPIKQKETRNLSLCLTVKMH